MREGNVLVCFFILFMLLACHSNPDEQLPDPVEHIENERVRDILSKSINASGSWDLWMDWKKLNYQKEFNLYTEQGEVERSANQNHRYRQDGDLYLNISWKDQEEEHSLIYDKGVSREYINGELKEIDEESIYVKIMTSWFAFALPWKLADPGIAFEYIGEGVAKNERQVDIIKAVFNASDNPNHTKSDIWWFSFDKQSGELLEYMVQHGDTYAKVVNDKSIEVDGFIFPGIRTSYRVDSMGNILFKRASYVYSDYEVVN